MGYGDGIPRGVRVVNYVIDDVTANMQVPQTLNSSMVNESLEMSHDVCCQIASEKMND